MLKKLMIAAGIALLFGGTFSYAKAEDRELFKVDIRTNDAVKKEEIKKLQGFLINQKLLSITEPNGNFGPMTKAAVKKLQKDLDLPQVGAVGPATRAKINTAIEDKTSDETNDKVIVKINDATLIVPNNKMPRVMFWWGKVNQHIDLATGTWQTDSNGLEPYAGASVDKLEYCKRIYPTSIAIKAYMFETIPTWHDRGNVNNYTSTNLSYRCIQEGEKINEISEGNVLGVATSSIETKAESKNQKSLNFTFTKQLIAGAKGEEVIKLQKVLVENGYLEMKNLTGVMDDNTVSSLKFFQEENKLEITGTLGPKTRVLLSQLSRQIGLCSGNQQKIIVGKPNGGEVYQAGQQIQVRWRTCNIPSNQNVRIDLDVAPFPPIGYNGVGLTNTINDGREMVTLPADSAFNGNPMSFGQNFKIAIWYPNGSTYSPIDLSNNLFTINPSSNAMTACLLANPLFSVTTTPATVYSPNMMMVNGDYAHVCSPILYGWTEYGLTSQLGTQMPMIIRMNLSQPQASNPPQTGWNGGWGSGLSVTPNTTYYHKACAKDINNTIVCGSTMSFTSPSGAQDVVKATLDSASPSSGIVHDNQVVETAKFKFEAVNAGYAVSDITLNIPTTGTYTAQSVMLYDSTTLIASVPVLPVTIFSGLSWNIPANTSKVLTIKMQLGSIGMGAGTTQAEITTILTGFSAINMSTGISSAGTESDPSGNVLYVMAALPLLLQEQLSSTTLVNGSNRPIVKYSVQPQGGQINWNQVAFDVQKDQDTIVGISANSGLSLWDVTSGGNTQINGVFINQGASSSGTTGTIIFTASNEVQVSSNKMYELRATISNANGSGDFINTTISNDTVSFTPVTTAALVAVANPDASFIWSDLSSFGHSVATTDWTSDYLIQNLPLSGSLNF